MSFCSLLLFILLRLVNADLPLFSPKTCKEYQHEKDAKALTPLDSSILQVRCRMTDPEKLLLLRLLQRSKSYFEFGSGGSTEMACELAASHNSSLQVITSIDSSLEWINKEKKKAVERHISLNLHYVDIGAIKEWGRPSEDNKLKHIWTKYWTSFTDFKGENADLVLIDGRFRASCALYVLLTSTNDGLLMMIHDFTGRKEYHIILPFVEIVACVDELIVLKKKAHVVVPALVQALVSVMFDFS